MNGYIHDWHDYSFSQHKINTTGRKEEKISLYLFNRIIKKNEKTKDSLSKRRKRKRVRDKERKSWIQKGNKGNSKEGQED